MSLTKVWLQEEIDTEPNPAIKLALERVMSKYTESPAKTSTKLKEFDADETFKKIVHYYVDKQNYSLEKAEEIAKSVVQREKDRRNLV